jgi:hypothetical protein
MYEKIGKFIGGGYYRGLRVADNHCVHPEMPVVHFIPDSAVRWMI